MNTSIKELTVPSDSCNQHSIKQFSIINYPNLETVIIGNNSFLHVSEFTLQKNSKLRVVSIGDNSYTESVYSHGYNTTKVMTITGCSLLHDIAVGSYSFSDYGVLIIDRSFCFRFLTDLPQLTSLKIGNAYSASYNFYKATVNVTRIVFPTRRYYRFTQSEQLCFGRRFYERVKQDSAFGFNTSFCLV